MAYLNVRERRIEAKIAYLGPELAGRTTNFERLAAPASGSKDARIGKVRTSSDETAARLSLAWQLEEATRFRDCDVVVELVAPCESATDDLLREADGVVVVVDAAPSSQDRNRASLASVQKALERIQRGSVPLVVQINKVDLPDALSVESVVDGLDAAALPHVSAIATQGQGVVETLATAMDGVLAAMQTRPDETHATHVDPTHPLLSALQEVLRQTVRDHLDEVSSTVADRVEASITRLEDRLRNLEASIARVDERVLSLEASSTNADNRVETLQESLDDRLQRLDTSLHERLHNIETAAAQAETRARAIEANTSRLDLRLESLSSTVAEVGEQVGWIVVERKETKPPPPPDPRQVALAEGVDALAANVVRLAERVDRLTSGVDSVFQSTGGLGSRIQEVETSLKQRSARVEDIVRAARADAEAGRETTDATVNALKSRVDEVFEELKRSKKGWFT